MNRVAIYTACAILVAAPASAQSVSERLGLNAVLGVSPSTQDFVNEVALNEMLEIELSKLAEEKGDARTKEFAKKMLKEHAGTSAQLKALVQNGQVKHSPQHWILPVRRGWRNLRVCIARSLIKHSRRCRSAFTTIQSLSSRYGSGSDHRDLKVFAYKHLPHLQEHWRLARDLKK